MSRSYRNRFIKKQKQPKGVELISRRILAVSIMSGLEENGFTRCQRLETKYGDNSEIVYAKPLKKGSRRIIVVYTSCNQVGGAYVARPAGKDAIRVAGLYINKEGKTKGIVKNKRVNRVNSNEDIVKRLIQRIAKTTKALDTAECCDHCGSPKFISKNNNLVCSELCWR